MRRRLVVWFAVFATALLVIASPASAATATVSTNTTDTELASATTLDNLDIEGSGESASAVVNPWSTTDSFEDGDLSEYSQTGGAGWTTSTSRRTDGSVSLYSPSGVNDQIYSSSGLPDYPERGDDIRVDFYRGSNGGLSFYFGTQADEYHNSYAVRIDSYQDEIELIKYDGGAKNVLDDAAVDSPNGEWVEIEIEWRNTISVVIRDSSGSIVATLSGTDTTYSSGGFGINTGGEAYWVDAIEVNDGAADGQFVGSPHDVDKASEGFVNLTLSSGSATATLEGSNGGGWTTIGSSTVSSSGTETVAISSEYQQYRWNVTFDEAAGSVDAEGIRAETSSPTFSDPDPADGSQVSDYDGDISINVSDPDLGTTQGDNVTVVARSGGSTIGSTTITANGTVSFAYSPDAGENSVSWEASDSYETANASFDQSFTTPAELILLEETTSEPITESGTAEVTFFGETTVETRPIDNGAANLTGLPADETFVAVVDMDGYYQRRILIEDLFTQQRVFLLDENETAVDVEFRLDDSTGQFSDGDVELTVEKAIVINNSTEFRTVVGDRISASGGLPASLEQGARYRLTVSKDGNTRSLGSWTASSSGFVTLPIGRVEISGELNDEGWLLEHSIDEPPEGSSSEGVLRLKYVDKANRTDSIETQVVRLDESGNVSEVVLANATETDSQSVVRSVEVNNTSDTFELRFTLVRDGETITGQRKLGALEGITLPVDAGWLNLISWVAVIAFGGLVVIKDSRAAALVMAGIADLFAMLGWLQAPTAVLALGSAGAIVYAVAGYGGGY